MSLRVFVLALFAAVLLHLGLAKLLPELARGFDPFVVVTVLNGLGGHSLFGMLGGLLCGLAHDTWSGGPFGLHGLADTLVGYATARVAQRLVTRRLSGLLAVLLCATGLQQAMLVAIEVLLISGGNLPDPGWVASRAVTSALFCLAVYRLTERTRLRLEESRRQKQSRLRLD